MSSFLSQRVGVSRKLFVSSWGLYMGICAAALFTEFKEALKLSWPVMVGYLILAIPCGILEHTAGFSMFQIILLSVFFYSGAGQFMLPGFIFAGIPLLSSFVSLLSVNARHMLYSAALSPYFKGVSKAQRFASALYVTDESFALALSRYQAGATNPRLLMFINLACHLSWIVANVSGALIAEAFEIPQDIAAFSMTSIFLALLCLQEKSGAFPVVVAVSFMGVLAAKLMDIPSFAIMFGALSGVVAGVFFGRSQ